MADMVQAKEAFTGPNRRRIAARQLVKRSDPIVKGRESMFLTVDGEPVTAKKAATKKPKAKEE